VKLYSYLLVLGIVWADAAFAQLNLAQKIYEDIKEFDCGESSWDEIRELYSIKK